MLHQFFVVLFMFQYFAGGAGAEGEIAKYLEKIQTITKLGYNFTVPSYRSKVDTLIMRNLDYGEYQGAGPWLVLMTHEGVYEITQAKK